MTSYGGHMNPYEGHGILESFRERCSNPRPPRAASADGESRARARTAPRVQPLEHSEGTSVPRARWSRRRTSRGANASLSVESPGTRSAGNGKLSRQVARIRGCPSRTHGRTPATTATNRKAPLKLTTRATLAEVAIAVGDALRRAGIRGVLTGGAGSGQGRKGSRRALNPGSAYPETHVCDLRPVPII